MDSLTSAKFRGIREADRLPTNRKIYVDIRSLIQRCYSGFSYWGLMVATVFFAFSLTPSLLPRHYAVQGVLSGFALATGYGVGVLCVWLWNYLEFQTPGEKLVHISKQITTVATALIAVVYLWRDTVWQNSIRELMDMEPVKSMYPTRVVIISLITALALVFLSRGLRWCWLLIHRKMLTVVPRRVSYVLTTLVLIILVFMFANHLVARLALDLADRTFLRIDEFVDEGIARPENPLASGSVESLIPWDSIGLQGKRFITQGPTQEQISEFSGKEAKQPLRVYVGLRTKDTIAERAQLALEELIRVNAFDREVLIVATPTGTGWLDPAAVDTVEYMHNGNTAIVSIQYSYLPSWITILVDSYRSRDSAQALFDVVYDHWKTLPVDKRPRLYVHGLSLGSLGSESSADLFTIFEDPIQGGVWSGPPFPSAVWNKIVSHRNPDSPSWLPHFRDGSIVRFTGLENSLNKWGKRWSPMRFVYIQYASDPMIFFSPDLLYRSPNWLTGKRGPDVSPFLRWFPIVTFLQTAFDLPMATSVPVGYGHNYSARSYIDAWVAVTEPKDWNEADTERLKEVFKGR
jgi:uncharacterized membrane protein